MTIDFSFRNTKLQLMMSLLTSFKSSWLDLKTIRMWRTFNHIFLIVLKLNKKIHKQFSRLISHKILRWFHKMKFNLLIGDIDRWKFSRLVRGFWMKKKSMIIVSNDMTHDKHCVCTFLNQIYDYLTSEKPNVKTLSIFSDGCAAQFKNRFTMYNLISLKSKYGLDISWSFFATSHGKECLRCFSKNVRLK